MVLIILVHCIYIGWLHAVIAVARFYSFGQRRDYCSSSNTMSMFERDTDRDAKYNSEEVTSNRICTIPMAEFKAACLKANHFLKHSSKIKQLRADWRSCMGLWTADRTASRESILITIRCPFILAQRSGSSTATRLTSFEIGPRVWCSW